MKLYENLVNAGLDIDPSHPQFKRLRTMNFILYLNVIINAAVIQPNHIAGYTVYPITNLIVVVIGIIGILLLRQGKKFIPPVAHISILTLYMITIPALIEGGIANSGFVWFFIIPLTSIHLLGNRVGMYWVYLMFATELSAFFFLNPASLPYEKPFLFYHMISLAVGTIFIRFYQSTIDLFEEDLRDKNIQLNRLTYHLQHEVEKEVNANREKDIQLQQSSKMAALGDMVSNISHQWKQPLSIINTIVYKIQMARALDKHTYDLDDELKGIVQQSTLMQETMHDFLRFTRPDTKDEAFFVNSAFRTLLSLVEPSYTASNIKLDVTLLDTDEELFGKRSEFIHAIMNILNNAKDAMLDKEQSNGHIDISMSKENNDLRLCIQDNAGGIPEEILEKVFEPYFSTKLDKGGTGLGLNFTRQVVVEHLHGTICVYNKDEGACFEIHLPLDL